MLFSPCRACIILLAPSSPSFGSLGSGCASLSAAEVRRSCVPLFVCSVTPWTYVGGMDRGMLVRHEVWDVETVCLVTGMSC
jgi:hypothetical protein